MNNEITAKELLVVDDQGQSLGTLTREQALQLAQSKQLDLIEIAPQARPPVARIMSFDKFRYDQEKKEKKQRAQQRTQGMKQIQISVREAQHDLERKRKRAEEFMEEGNQVEILMVVRGRERANKDWARKKLEEFLATIQMEYKRLSQPTFAGRGFSVQISKK